MESHLKNVSRLDDTRLLWNDRFDCRLGNPVRRDCELHEHTDASVRNSLPRRILHVSERQRLCQVFGRPGVHTRDENTRWHTTAIKSDSIGIEMFAVYWVGRGCARLRLRNRCFPQVRWSTEYANSIRIAICRVDTATPPINSVTVPRTMCRRATNTTAFQVNAKANATFCLLCKRKNAFSRFAYIDLLLFFQQKRSRSTPIARRTISV